MEENASYQELFLEWKNIVPSQSYRIFKSRKHIQLHLIAHENFNRDSSCFSPEIDFLVVCDMIEEIDIY